MVAKSKNQDISNIFVAVVLVVAVVVSVVGSWLVIENVGLVGNRGFVVKSDSPGRVTLGIQGPLPSAGVDSDKSGLALNIVKPT